MRIVTARVAQRGTLPTVQAMEAIVRVTSRSSATTGKTIGGVGTAVLLVLPSGGRRQTRPSHAIAIATARATCMEIGGPRKGGIRRTGTAAGGGGKAG